MKSKDSLGFIEHSCNARFETFLNKYFKVGYVPDIVLSAL